MSDRPPISITAYEKVHRSSAIPPDDPDAFAYFVVCGCCAVEGPWSKSSENGARIQWNRRVMNDAELRVREVVDRLNRELPEGPLKDLALTAAVLLRGGDA